MPARNKITPRLFQRTLPLASCASCGQWNPRVRWSEISFPAVLRKTQCWWNVLSPHYILVGLKHGNTTQTRLPTHPPLQTGRVMLIMGYILLRNAMVVLNRCSFIDWSWRRTCVITMLTEASLANKSNPEEWRAITIRVWLSIYMSHNISSAQHKLLLWCYSYDEMYNEDTKNEE